MKKFELCVRNFEETYIAMIRDLQIKTFKLSVENNNHNKNHMDYDNQESQSLIIMKKRQEMGIKLS